MLHELGYEFLYVDGHCHYWVNEPSTVVDDYRAWRPYREGVLTTEQEMALHDVVSYDDPGRRPSCIPLATTDVPLIELWDAIDAATCRGNLEGPPDWPMRAELFAKGRNMMAAMRIVVGKEPAPADAPRYPWVLDDPPDSYVVDYARGLMTGQSKAVVDVAQASALRLLRAQVVDDATKAPGYFYGIIYLDRPGLALVIRDDLPFTIRADGLWSPP
jgi:hypothetical protein